jgi:8-oxo-dGTP pyrophosphatase MutT (NUDIX family)
VDAADLRSLLLPTDSKGTPTEDPADSKGTAHEDATESGRLAGTRAAVLLPLYGWPEDPGLIFTERRADLRRHAGEVSFPGGRHDDGDSDLTATALREAEEEIGLAGAAVELTGALSPVSTFATGYMIHPFVGLIPHPAELSLEPNPAEVETLLAFSLDVLREGYAMRRLIRRGIPFHTPSYEVEGQLIWGATARILGDLLERIDSGGA